MAGSASRLGFSLCLLPLATCSITCTTASVAGFFRMGNGLFICSFQLLLYILYISLSLFVILSIHFHSFFRTMPLFEHELWFIFLGEYLDLKLPKWAMSSLWTCQQFVQLGRSSRCKKSLHERDWKSAFHTLHRGVAEMVYIGLSSTASSTSRWSKRHWKNTDQCFVQKPAQTICNMVAEVSTVHY